MGSVISIAFDIAPSNTSSHTFEIYDSTNPAQLVLKTETFTSTEISNTCVNVSIDESDFDLSWGIWNDGGTDARRTAADIEFANGGTGRCVRLVDNSDISNNNKPFRSIRLRRDYCRLQLYRRINRMV